MGREGLLYGILKTTGIFKQTHFLRVINLGRISTQIKKKKLSAGLDISSH